MRTKENAPGAESGGGVLQSTRKETETGATPASGSSLPTSSSETINDFLSRFRPGGPWVLTAIQPDRKAKAIDTQTFADADEAAHWACEQNAERNVYFAVNPLRRAVTKKADREDVAAVEYLHVDIDPRAGEDLDEERERARALLLGDSRPESVPPPTCVVFSGGGYQAFWKLKEPIPVDGDLAKAEDAARYNQRLEVLLDADNTRDVCRIMRLPGTVNIPDARKRKKGRTEELATVVEFDPERVYPISDFEKATTSNMPAPTPTGASEPTKLDSLDELDQYSVPDRVKVIIAQGHHPDETKERDNSRSAWLFDAVCNLARHDVPEGVVLGLITDAKYGISESVLEQGRNAEEYALRQIERARLAVDEPDIAQMNERHAVIKNWGSKTRIALFERDERAGRYVVIPQTFPDLAAWYLNKPVKVGEDDKGNPKYMNLDKYWKTHPKRREYDYVTFAPGRDIPNALNLWRGFGVEPKEGDWSRMQYHIREVLAAGNESHARYITRWVAWALQNPGRPAEVAVVLKGGRGTGKGVFGEMLRRIFGQHGMQVSSVEHVAGRFNAHQQDCAFLFADEAMTAKDKEAESALKRMLTEPTLAIEAKGHDIITAPNCLHVVMASNYDWVVPAGVMERRFAVFDLSTRHAQDKSYFAPLWAEVKGDGPAAMLHELRNMKLDGWHPRDDVPQTEALADQKARSLPPLERVMYEVLQEGELPMRIENPESVFVPTSTIRAEVRDRTRWKETNQRISSLLHQQLAIPKDRRKNGGGHGYVFPSLRETRERWARAGLPSGWGDEEDADWSGRDMGDGHGVF